MGSSTRECKRIREIQFEVKEGDGGRRALKLESDRLVGTLGEASDSYKRRKLCCPCLEFSSSFTSSSSDIHPLDTVALSADHSETVATSDCSIVDSASSFQFHSLLSDLKVTEEENSILNSEFSADRRKMKPAPAEIEEFFSAAEKREKKRFADKYNYDIVRDVPLEGRYQWVRLKQ